MSGRPSAQAGNIGSDLTEKISVQCTAEQKLALIKLARSRNLSSSAMVRQWIDNMRAQEEI